MNNNNDSLPLQHKQSTNKGCMRAGAIVLLVLISLAIVYFILSKVGESGKVNKDDDITKEYQEYLKQDKIGKEVALSSFSKEDVARFAISSIMIQPSKNISVKVEDKVYYTSYIRKSDSKKFDYKIKFENDLIVWGNIDGRWRDDARDERIYFKEEENKIVITQWFSDGSRDVKEYKKGE